MNYDIENILQKLNRIEEKIDRKVNKYWMSIAEVSQVSSLSRSTINRAIKKGELKTVLHGGKRMIKKEWLDKWIMS
jgi:excisionase family DNA binding protein|tara:strand:+ start:428 stop:655 length:228 start_codon:yes stop_codon:yes gene_type:complete